MPIAHIVVETPRRQLMGFGESDADIIGTAAWAKAHPELAASSLAQAQAQVQASAPSTSSSGFWDVLGQVLKGVQGAVAPAPVAPPSQMQLVAAQQAQQAQSEIFGLPKPVVYGAGALAVLGIGYAILRKRG